MSSFNAPLKPFQNGSTVTTSDSADIPETRAVFVGGAGNLTVILAGGGQVTFNALTAGTLLDIAVKRILTTGTTATLILALY
jgi:hypothetical protein